jgi:transcriptional regulator with XRE-family HTH domain
VALEDFLAVRPCPTCEGDGEDLYFDGAAFRAARKACGFDSLREFAEILECSKTHLSDLERNKRDFTEDFARRYLNALGLL